MNETIDIGVNSDDIMQLTDSKTKELVFIKVYSVGEAAKILGLHKDTLRYYDKICLVQPTRGENGYRYYTQADLLDLKYIEVMKFLGFSLSEVDFVMGNRRGGSYEGLANTMGFLKEKEKELQEKVKLYNLMIQFIRQASGTLEKKEDLNDTRGINDFVLDLFDQMMKSKPAKKGQ